MYIEYKVENICITPGLHNNKINYDIDKLVPKFQIVLYIILSNNWNIINGKLYNIMIFLDKFYSLTMNLILRMKADSCNNVLTNSFSKNYELKCNIYGFLTQYYLI